MAGAAAEEAKEEGGRSRSIVHRSVLWFLGWSLCAMAVLAVGTVVVATELANDAALREATIRGAAIGRTVAGPLVNHRVRTGGPAERSTLDAVLRNRLDDQTIVHIKLWSRNGTVIWADEKKLVGRTFRLPPEVRKLFGTDAVSANFSDLSENENSAERADAPLLEVYSRHPRRRRGAARLRVRTGRPATSRATPEPSGADWFRWHSAPWPSSSWPSSRWP